MRSLTVGEKVRLELKPPSLGHNVIDAVGLGLHHFGRLFRC